MKNVSSGPFQWGSKIVSNYAATFDGSSNAYLEGESVTIHQLGPIDYIISVWIYPTVIDGTPNQIVSRAAVFSHEYSLYQINNDIYFTIGDGLSDITNCIASSVLTVNTWHHIIGWHDVSEKQLNLSIDNATPVIANYTFDAAVSPTAGFEVGSTNSGSNLYVGRIDSLMIFKPTDVSAIINDVRTILYNNGRPLSTPDLTPGQISSWGGHAGYDFEEQSGNSRVDGIGDNDLTEGATNSVLRRGGSSIPLSIETTTKMHQGIQLQADPANTGTIYLGFNNTVTVSGNDTTNGYPLDAGDDLFLPVRNPKHIYVVTADSDQKINFLII